MNNDRKVFNFERVTGPSLKIRNSGKGGEDTYEGVNVT